MTFPGNPVYYFSVREYTPTYLYDGFVLECKTDVPCHLYCRMSLAQPRKHIVPRSLRGIEIPGELYYCFTAYEDNEQTEGGDTTEHTFFKPSWPNCQTRWFYFWGEINGVPSCSTTAPFKLHFKASEAPPESWSMRPFNSIEPQLYHTNVTNDWETKTMPIDIAPQASALLFHVVSRDTGQERYFGLRQNGQTWDAHGAISRSSQTWMITGIDTLGRFQLYSGNPTFIDFWCMGYFGREFHWITEPPNVTPSLPGVWEKFNAKALYPKAIAVAVCIGPTTVWADAYGLRRGDSSDQLYYVGYHNCGIVGLDDTGVFEIKVQRIEPERTQAYLIGYWDGAIDTYQNALDLPGIPAASWKTISLKMDSQDAKLGIIDVVQTIGSRNWGVRKADSYRSILTPRSFHQWAFVNCNEQSQSDFYKQDSSVHFYQIGRLPPAFTYP